MPEFGVIGGSGVYDIPGLEISGVRKVTTPYGDPSDAYRIGRLAGREIAFLPRHGACHTIQPHRINYRANINGFRRLGVTRLLSVGAVGGISPGMKPGILAVPDQVLDHTSGRVSTFFDGDEVVHVDFTAPFCPDLRRYVIASSGKAGIGVIPTATYICVDGPRLESAAEIRAFAAWGADIVGMTAMPEAALAREAGICYAGISVVTNAAAGISGNRLSSAEVKEMMALSEEKLRTVLLHFFGLDFEEPSCSCRGALDEARM
ncbi:MAG: S-methyl-5'-thioadenosine phosphorylase [Nitrospiraceae bacterium]|nr:S-methyl-5'-thioadenosine phosphorylase [Nitrospiraceae bacterium]